MQQRNIIKHAQSVAFERNKKGDCLHIVNQSADALISLYGAQLLSFVPHHDKRERMWLSQLALFEQGSAIRGGAPICWPWFGPHKTQSEFPAHGFVRTQVWQLISIDEIRDEHGVTETVCRFKPQTLGLCDVPEGLSVELLIGVGERCEISVITHNHSKIEIPLSQAIHSYFAVDDIAQVSIEGVDEQYFDKLSGTHGNSSPNVYTIVGETDRVHAYSGTYPQKIEILTAGKNLVHIEQEGNNAVVVWNPWKEKSQIMQDMQSNDYSNMLCIEAATEPFIALAPGQQHILSQRFR